LQYFFRKKVEKIFIPYYNRLYIAITGYIMIRENGRPLDAGQREENEKRVYDWLDGLGVPYARVDHEAAQTMEICLGIEGVLGAPICKNLFLCNRQQTDFYLLLMPGDKPFRTKELSSQIGTSRLSFATPEHMARFLGVTPGSVTVLGLMNDQEHAITLLIDKDLLQHEHIGCHPCVNTATLALRTEDVLDTLLPSLGITPVFVSLPYPS